MGVIGYLRVQRLTSSSCGGETDILATTAAWPYLCVRVDCPGGNHDTLEAR